MRAGHREGFAPPESQRPGPTPPAHRLRTIAGVQASGSGILRLSTRSQVGSVGIDGAISKATAGGIRTDSKRAGNRLNWSMAAKAISGLEFETTANQRDSLSSISRRSSSLLNCKYGMPRSDACRINSSRLIPSSCAAFPLDSSPWRYNSSTMSSRAASLTGRRSSSSRLDEIRIEFDLDSSHGNLQCHSTPELPCAMVRALLRPVDAHRDGEAHRCRYVVQTRRLEFPLSNDIDDRVSGKGYVVDSCCFLVSATPSSYLVFGLFWTQAEASSARRRSARTGRRIGCGSGRVLIDNVGRMKVAPPRLTLPGYGGRGR